MQENDRNRNGQNAQQKPKCKGRVISSDYRAAFRKMEEQEQREKEKNFAPVPKSKPELPKESVQPEPAAEPESDKQKALPDKKAMPQAQTKQMPKVQTRGTHKVPSMIVGVIVLLFALVGVGYLSVAIGTQIHHAVTDDSRQREYDEFLRPLVMQDPAPFASLEEADDQMILSASLWKALQDHVPYTDYDESGRTIVPLADVFDACQELFGPDAKLQLNHLSADTFFTFDVKTNRFHVAPYGTESSFLPWTESISSRDGKTVLRVGYVAPNDPWREGDAAGEKQPTPVKYMEYVLSQGEEKEYVERIQKLEDKKEESSQKQK